MNKYKYNDNYIILYFNIEKYNKIYILLFDSSI